MTIEKSTTSFVKLLINKSNEVNKLNLARFVRIFLSKIIDLEVKTISETNIVVWHTLIWPFKKTKLR